MERAPALAFLDKLHATLFRKEGTFVGSDFYGDIYQAVSWLFHINKLSSGKHMRQNIDGYISDYTGVIYNIAQV